MKNKILNKEIYSYSNDNLVVEVERGFNLGYWDKALVPELKKRFKELEKQEKLLELYKEINDKRKELITLARYNTWSWKLDIEIKEIQDKIKELENEGEIK